MAATEQMNGSTIFGQQIKVFIFKILKPDSAATLMYLFLSLKSAA